MISSWASIVPKEDVFICRLLYCDSRRSETCCRHSQACRWLSQVLQVLLPALPGLSPVLPDAHIVLPGTLRCSQSYHNHSHGTPPPGIRDPSYPEGWQGCPPRVWYSPEIDKSRFTLHILSDTPQVVQWLKCILLMVLFVYSNLMCYQLVVVRLVTRSYAMDRV